MQKNIFFIITILLTSFNISAQTSILIKGTNEGVATFYVENGTHVNVSGGVEVDGSESTQASPENYIQNNGTIHLNAGTTSGQSNFINNVNDLKTYSSGQNSGEVIFEATNNTQQIIGNGTVEFMNLKVNNTLSPQLELWQNASVAGNLHIGGLIKLGNNDLSLLPSGVISGAPYTIINMIQADGNGQFIRSIAVGAGIYLYPLGDQNGNYSPLNLEFNENIHSGVVGANLKAITHPEMNNPETVTDYLSRYWTLNSDSLSTYNYKASFSYITSDINGNEQNIRLNRWQNEWFQIDESSASLNNLISTDFLNETNMPIKGDFTGRYKVSCIANAGEIISSSETVCMGDLTNLSVEGSSGTIQWQSSNNPNSFSNIEGETNNTLNLGLNESTYFRVYSTSNGDCSDTSAVIFINAINSSSANFTYTQNSGYTVDFSNTSTFGTVVHWDFGGGNFSNQFNPSFTYPFDGTYPVKLIVSNECGADTLIINIQVSKFVSVNEVNAENINIFPNPSDGQIFIQVDGSIAEIMELSVHNALGQLVLIRNVNTTLGSLIEIDLSSFKNGLYVLKVNNSHKQFTKKLMIVR